MSAIQSIKTRFGIIGNDPGLIRALEKALQVSPTDISVLVIGESGVGKEFIPKIIHTNSHRKHNSYIVVNCGAIPEGTIDSELFGHEKGSFTGATTTRKGYFEEADGGTIFLDEVGELPLQTQVRLLRVLESGEFMKVGSSQVQKTNVRIVAATNVNMMDAISKGKFREDLYYRLNTVQIDIPPLRARRGDIRLLFRKFSVDFAEKYRMPELELSTDGAQLLEQYSFPGNVRQLRNLVEQMTVIEQKRVADAAMLQNYIPKETTLPAVVPQQFQSQKGGEFSSEREILYKILFDMRNDINELKSITGELVKGGTREIKTEEELSKRLKVLEEKSDVIDNVYNDVSPKSLLYLENQASSTTHTMSKIDDFVTDVNDNDVEFIEEKSPSLSLVNNEKELIIKALEKYKGRRNKAADELGISQRTLYRKIKQFNIED